MIRFEVFGADGERLISNDWADSEARQLAAYRMRWLSRRPGRWARTTDGDGRVRTFGDVPEGQEAPAGHYVARRVNADFSDGEIVKHFTPQTTKGRAEEWRLSNRMGVNGELVICWAEDKPEPKVHHFESTQDAYDDTQARDDIADGDVLVVLPEHVVGVLVGAHPVAITGNHGELHACEGGEAALARVDGGKYAASVAVASQIARTHFAEITAKGQAEGTKAAAARTGDPEPQALTVTFDRDARRYDATRDGDLVAFARWSGDVLKVCLPGGMFIGLMYRSDGQIVNGETVYTYRAWTGSAAKGPFSGSEREVARGASMADAISALLKAAAQPSQPSTEPRRYGAGKGFTIGQARAAMRKVGDELEASADRLAKVLDAGEYYVMPHGFTAPASWPVARFPYVGLEAGDSFDQALAWARKYVKTSFDVWHADAEQSTFIVQVMADGRLLWPSH